MNDTDDSAFPLTSEYLVPPLSPTKTVSTEEWSSPRTPRSPRKSRSCLFFRDVDNAIRDLHLTPTSSPRKSKFSSRLDALPNPVFDATKYDSSPVQPHDDSPVKPQRLSATDPPSSYLSHDLSIAHARSLPVICKYPIHNEVPLPPSRMHDSGLDRRSSLPKRRKHSNPVSLEGLFPSSGSRTSLVTQEGQVRPITSHIDTPATKSIPENKLRPFPLCYSSSPIRSSRSAAREGLLESTRYSQTGTPDRFIAYRRPPAVARESFELNSPAERRRTEQATNRGTHTNADAFSRRLSRSGRLNEELRGLRETHSMILGRVNANRRNIHFRRGSVPLAGRQISTGAVWNVGGPSAVSDTVVAVSTGRGRMLGSGTNAPLYKSAFLSQADPEAELEAYAQRLALALDIDRTDRILQHSPLWTSRNSLDFSAPSHGRHVWRDSAWIKENLSSLLDAPDLRDDYYCTLVAYSDTSKCLAVGLGNFVHIWSERSGVNTPESLNARPPNSIPVDQHVTSLSFSSECGGQAILAAGRADGRISLWSPFDSEPRFDVTQPKSVSCVSWRPTVVQRPSLRDRAMTVPTEELIIGDEVGHIYFYSVEWPSETQSALFGWHGAMTLLARLAIHSQQICGLTWSLDGELFASGGNDNNCNLFETKKVLRQNPSGQDTSTLLDVRQGSRGESIYTVSNRDNSILHLTPSAAKHTWTLNAAVKAIAFCPWQRGLIAIGGGSNDRCIHFYHTRSGTCLATIDCAAQVTSLIWSQTRREIAATFGFAQPEHPYRIAVFAWPSCEQLVAVPWYDENRALCAIAYPGGPTSRAQLDDDGSDGRARGEDGVWSRRGVEEGCIVVAASDMAIRFHEIWSDRRGSVPSGGLLGNGAMGLLGGSDILEGPYARGIESQGTVIR
ncbi:hypothetical protein GGP41_004788 [Bipolaris sorokiniana]|uniref:Anaphase-promoting complex subunit 4 WD40 domain-containing protein n=2 Tax=Cochliobolus sativus TaxID=45130 RepID=A0A8H5ZES0_COCSA|nr:uncharacterized protein COCSADRAFT_186165 [Bipolaris sorokiniana ND90Pr]EMD69197.1 hypothetical protein COCSADRAFT_186165 [Bipolaris sorokiniana ND90Pr]KAF5846740.1 hypothetical protein GGP41_004788 [Bipolaris sorokiniana]